MYIDSVDINSPQFIYSLENLCYTLARKIEVPLVTTLHLLYSFYEGL
jgi:hypothetical protein